MSLSDKNLAKAWSSVTKLVSLGLVGVGKAGALGVLNLRYFQEIFLLSSIASRF